MVPVPSVNLTCDLGSDIEISAPITLINDTNEDARVEINDGNSVRLHDVTVINTKGLIQLNDESNVTIDHISVESSAYLNLQVNKIDGSIEDTGIFTIGVIDLAENAKVAIRNIRRDANASLKKLEKETPEDLLRHYNEEIQKLTDEYVKKIDELAKAKEKELLTV